MRPTETEDVAVKVRDKVHTLGNGGMGGQIERKIQRVAEAKAIITTKGSRLKVKRGNNLVVLIYSKFIQDWT